MVPRVDVIIRLRQRATGAAEAHAHVIVRDEAQVGLIERVVDAQSDPLGNYIQRQLGEPTPDQAPAPIARTSSFLNPRKVLAREIGVTGGSLPSGCHLPSVSAIRHAQANDCIIGYLLRHIHLIAALDRHRKKEAVTWRIQTRGTSSLYTWLHRE